MKKACFFVLFLILLSVQNYLIAQKKPEIKFGKVVAADFVVNSPVVDSNANAVILADIGSSSFEGNTKGWFSLIFKRIKRVKILNKKGFDAADVVIGLYTSGTDEERLEDCKGITYNLENGELKQTKLDPKNIFKDPIRKSVSLRKFTMPDVKEGSIIEYSYTIKSDFLFALQPWTFQGEYPCLRSEYEVGIPEFFNYVLLTQGYIPIENVKNIRRGSFTVTYNTSATTASQSVNITGGVFENKWMAKDVPAIKEEPFTSSLDNHIAKIEFQLSQYRFPDEPVEDIMGSWPKVREKLMKDERFGESLNKNNGWMTDEIKQITGGAKTLEDSVRKIYAYIRDNFTSTGNGIKMSADNALKEVYKKKSGNTADINLLLTAMLKHINIDADPVILSTRSNGTTHPIYPLMDRFNYVICKAVINDNVEFLDATQPRLAFGRLPLACYNGHARIIAEQPLPCYFEADSLIENSTKTIFISNNESGGLTGSYKSDLGYYESLNLRNKLAKTSKEEYFKKIEANFTGGIKLSEGTVDSLYQYDEPVSVSYDLKFNFGDEDIIYFNPMLNDAQKNNPFKAAERKYPVEMPYTQSETFSLNMEIPKGYKVDEMPKSTRVKLNENEGIFEYIIRVDETNANIQFLCRLKLEKANYTPDDYQTLRDFFSYVVKKESEQIVFKKIK